MYFLIGGNNKQDMIQHKITSFDDEFSKAPIPAIKKKIPNNQLSTRNVFSILLLFIILFIKHMANN